MKIRLVLIGLTAACAPLIPEPPRGGPAQAAQPTAAAATATAAVQPVPYEDQSFEGWKQGFLARHGGANRAAFERELAGLSPDPSVIRLDGTSPSSAARSAPMSRTPSAPSASPRAATV